MAYEDLLKSVEDSAAEQERELRRRAAAAIMEIRERGRKQAESIHQALADEAHRSVATERNRALYLMKAENKESLIRSREEACTKAFSMAREDLAGLRADPKYPVIFKKLLGEAVEALNCQEFVIHIDGRDEILCRNTLDELRIQGDIRADLTTAGGVVLTLPDNSVVISNTVESRLEQVQEHQRHVIHAILSGV